MQIPVLELSRLNAPYKQEFLEKAAEFYDAGQLIGGAGNRYSEQFEANFAAYCGAAHCVGMSNGLDALVLALRALEIGAGDGVIVPAQTFIATWLAVSQVGAVPVPVDIHPRTANLDADLVEAAITPATKAIIAVHLHGYMADMDALRVIADKHGLALIEDAAQAHGHSRNGKPVGALGDIATFSFYPAKNLGALGDAGAAITNDATLAARMRKLSNYGSAKKYYHDVQGMNCRLDPIQAIFLDIKLAHLDSIIARRRAIAKRYSEVIPAMPDKAPFYRMLEPVADDSVWHNFVICCENRDAVQQQLAEASIGTNIHYPLIPALQECYKKDFAHTAPHTPHAIANSEQVLSLPIGEYLREEEVAQVVQALEKIYACVPS